ncbi:hypothetical protein ACFQGW_13655 [Xanthomonas theicola]|uniref:hypothetical protein n=1 Tax=Xanthomonas theicola TaxID=56464 RepID=UPI00361E9AFF
MSPTSPVARMPERDSLDFWHFNSVVQSLIDTFQGDQFDIGIVIDAFERFGVILGVSLALRPCLSVKLHQSAMSGRACYEL